MRLGVALADGQARFALVHGERAWWDPSGRRLPSTMDEALMCPLNELRERVSAPMSGLESRVLGAKTRLLPPVGTLQEVWASGVTYERSREARVAEATEPTVYDRVYEAERPELFLKAVAPRVVGDGDEVGIRADSTWNVPEPELTLVVNAHEETVGYTLGNDMSSRSIEGENPLYLPQAKTYERSCALGPAVVPAWEVSNVQDFAIRLSITRRGNEVFVGEIGVDAMRRPFETLVEYLFRSLQFPHGVLLMTGTGIVPADDFTLEPGDEVRIECEPIGALVNRVVVV